MNSAAVTALILPGLGNSGPQHWQSEWERHDSSMMRVMQAEWDAPRREDLEPLPFPSIVVASNDDIYVTEETARSYATAWGSRFVLLRGAGHINSDSGLGLWKEGLQLLDSLRQ